MYIFKLANAAASKITVTNASALVLDLITTAGSAANGIPGRVNSIDITPEDGDIRVTFDGNTPTAANGFLVRSGSTMNFRNVPLTKMRAIRAGGSNVACSLQVGFASMGEQSTLASPAGGSITIGSSVLTGGTTGSVLFVGAAGVIQQDNSNFFWDDTNNRLGINASAAPVTPLHVVGNSSSHRGFGNTIAVFEGVNSTIIHETSTVGTGYAMVNVAGSFSLFTNPFGTFLSRLTVVSTGQFQITPSANILNSTPEWKHTGAQHSSQTASTEVPDVFYNLARTVTWATGALATQRNFIVEAPTIAFAAASTATTVVAFSVPTNVAAGANATFTASWAIQAGGDVAGGPTSASMKYGTYHAKAHTVTVTGTTSATLSGSFSQCRLDVLTITDSSAVTISSVATLYIDGAPAAAGSVTLTSAFAIHVNAGRSFFGGGATTTNSTTSDAFGVGASANNDNTVAIGPGASTASGTHGIAVGRGAALGHTAGIALGEASSTTGNNQVVMGSSAATYNDVYIGNGVVSTAPTATAYNGSGGSGTNIVGGALTIAGGKGTGNAAGGSVIFSTSTAGASGTTLQSLTQRFRVDGTTGRFVMTSMFETVAGNEQTSVGAAGGGSALPATPTKYVKFVDSAGTTLVIPAYAAS